MTGKHRLRNSGIHPGREASQKLAEMLEFGYSLPSLSVIAIKLLEIASESTSSAHDLAALIEKDPSLAVRLVKLANSAFFGARHPVVTLQQAVTRVGFQRLRIIALSLSLRDTFPMGKVGPIDYEMFWRTSLYRALISKGLARRLAVANPEEAFLAGLILEIGLLIFFDLFIKGKDGAASLEPDAPESLLAMERERYGIDHREIGEAALRFWNFPESIAACQRFYGDNARNSEAPVLARLIEQARILAQGLFHQSTGLHSLFLDAERSIKLDHESVNAILCETFEQVEEIAGSLRIELNKERDLIQVLESANRSLAHLLERISTVKDILSQSHDSLPSLADLNRQDTEQYIVASTLQEVVHEIRNPLMAVGGFARRLSSTLDLSSESGRYARIIFGEALRLEKILSRIMEEKLSGHCQIQNHSEAQKE